MQRLLDWLFNIRTNPNSFAPPSYGAGTAPITYIFNSSLVIIGIGIGILIGFLIWGL